MITGKNLIIISQARSGSTLLKHLLNNHPALTMEGEIFSITDGYLKSIWALRFFQQCPHLWIALRKRICGTSSYGFTLFPFQLGNIALVLKRLRSKGWVIVFLNRHNTVDQVISHMVAQKTKNWHSYREPHSVDHPVILDKEKFIHRCLRVDRNKIKLNKLSEAFADFEVSYENHLNNEKQWQPTCNVIYDLLGLKHVSVNSTMTRTYRSGYADIVLNYHDLCNAYQGLSINNPESNS